MIYDMILRSQLLRIQSKARVLFNFRREKMEAANDFSMSTPNEIASSDAFEVVAVFDEFIASLSVASVFYGFIIGSKGTTISCIRSETDTEIKIPRGKNDKIEIRGKNRENVRSAGKQIEAIVSSSRDKLSVNHFTNVRIIDVGINGNYEQFMHEILQGPPIEGLTEAMFMRPNKLHITINVMTLVDDRECARAVQVLNDCVENVIVPAKNQFGKIALNVSGVKIFSDANPNKANVLFGRIESDSLQQIANGIMEYFIAEGVSKRERNETSVKMHMTLINTRYDKGESGKDGNGNGTPRYRIRKTIDATAILEKYKNYNFGSQEVNEILLSAMFEKDDDGFYKKIASVKF